MRRATLNLIFFIWMLSFVSVASAEPINQDKVMRAQGEMILRIADRIEKYTNSIGLEVWFISYCRVKMSMETEKMPKNGSIPFGVNYYDIVDSQTLDATIYAREAFETGYLMVCLSNAKTSIRSAKND